MRRISTALLLTVALAAAGPALAKSSQKFETSLLATSGPINVEVIISEDLAWRGDNLPKKMRDRGSSRSFNDGFSGNGFYGEKDLNRLAERLERKMEDRLQKQGVGISEDAAQTLRIVLTDARPNRPTFKQMSRQSNLSFRSYGLGGAAFEGELVNASGESQGILSYAWYESSIHNADIGGTWSDANYAIDRFAKKTAKAVK